MTGRLTATQHHGDTMITIERTSKNGKYGGTYRVTTETAGAIAQLVDQLRANRSLLAGQISEQTDNALTLRVHNGREQNSLYNAANAVQLRIENEQVAAQQRVEQQVRAERGEPQQPHRVAVREGSVRVGDTLHGRTVRGLGRAWVASADDPSRLGLEPETVGERVQYAYFAGQRR